ncbi:hypothetical protein WJX72_009606 [[Myrmecia] bisecta]|uniref:Raffinose synthase n=1 Tax=[Myrmecia] bisecta TaxID=41462 RepID=A0AAW1QFX8_9CHLO
MGSTNGNNLDGGKITLRIESGDSTVLSQRWNSALYIAAGWNPYEMVEHAVTRAASLSGGAKPRKDKELPPSLDYFGWCTWDAFYSRVSARGLHQGLSSLVEGGAPPRFLIIDDGWQCTNVDKDLREPPTSKIMPKTAVTEDTSDEYLDAEMDMLYMGAQGIPPSSSAGVLLEALAADEDNLEHHMHHKRRHRGKSRNRHTQSATVTGTWDSSFDATASGSANDTGSFDAGWSQSVDRSMDPSMDRSMDGSTEQSLGVRLDNALVQRLDRSLRQDLDQAAQQSGDRELRASLDEGMRRSNGSVGSSPDQPQTGAAGDAGAEQSNGSGGARSRQSAQSSSSGTSSTALEKPQAANTGRGGVASTTAPGPGTTALVKQEPAETRVAEPPRPLSWLVSALMQRVVGGLVGLLEALLLKFYQYVVDPAPPGSWPVALFTWIATGPLRSLLLDFYAASGDFTRRLTSIKANSKFSSPFAGPEDFFSGEPEQLGTVIMALRELYNLRYIYCWHGLPAYWSGVATGAEEPDVAKYEARIMFAEPTPGLLEVEPSMAWNPSVVSGIGVIKDPYTLFNDMHSYLSDAGVTGVKVDCQAGVGLIGSALGGGPAMAAQYHSALEASVAAHFPGNHAINCMCHSTENIYRFTNTAVARASDDFYPRDPASSHPHVGACAFNSMFLSALVQTDWDMFHSKHHAAELHATARVVSGGPLYVSDYPGEHDFDLLRRLVLPDGSILRALLPGRPTRDSLFCDVLRDGKSLLKVWNINRHGGIVGVFNLQGSAWSRTRRQFLIHDKNPRPLTCTVFVALDSHTGRMQRLGLDEGLSVEVAGGKSTVVTIAPIEEQAGVAFAAVGLTNMFNSGGAVMSCILDARGDSSDTQSSSSSGGQAGARVAAYLTIKGSGTLLMYANQAPAAVRVGGQTTEFAYKETESRLEVELPTPASDQLQQDVTVCW